MKLEIKPSIFQLPTSNLQLPIVGISISYMIMVRGTP